MSLGQLGTLQSPGFPRSYPSNINCKWTLVAENDRDTVQLIVSYVALEKNYDKLTVCAADECSEQDTVMLTGITKVLYLCTVASVCVCVCVCVCVLHIHVCR